MRVGICNKPIVPLYETAQFAEGWPEAVAGIADELLYGWSCQIHDETEKYPQEAEENSAYNRQRLQEERKRCLEVTTEYGYTGYVRQEDLIIYNKEPCMPENILIRYICRNCVDILSMPRVQGKVLMTLYRGSYIRISDSFCGEDGWREVILNNGSIGYIQDVLFKEITPARKPERDLFSQDIEFRRSIVNSAMAYLGVQYRWGGKTPLGIDCSGLAFMSYFENGISIYRDSQIMEGFPVQKIPNHMMDKGDLLYFPGHVAVYLGDGKYIHATAHKDSYGVVINSLYPWDRDFREELYEKFYAVGSVF